MAFRKVPRDILGVSEPSPYMFGNNANEPDQESWTNSNWLKSRFHFSFAEYYNPANQNFGVLRVMNDDLVQPGRGFGMHGHRDAEICTYVVQGNLTHQDSMGTAETLGRGAIQFMTAGSGVQHSEHNFGQEPLRFIQMWLTPRRGGLAPNYGSSSSAEADRQDRWAHLVCDVSDSESPANVQINTDANIYVTEISDGNELPLTIEPGRQAYMLCLEGATTVTGDSDHTVRLEQHDAVEIDPSANINLTGYAHLLLVEMAHVAGSGRGDIAV